MDLTETLHHLLPSPCCARPFVCDGRPEACEVIVIGENPVTKLDTDWWSFWNDASGFDLERFEEAYERARSCAGKRPISNTRLRLKRLRNYHGLQCLEANVFINERPGGHGGGIPCDDLLRAFFRYLPHLKAVIVHGKIAKEYVNKHGIPAGIQLHFMRHFRNESYDNIAKIARCIPAI